MLIKTILTFALSLSVLSCYADSGQSESKPLIDAQKKSNLQPKVIHNHLSLMHLLLLTPLNPSKIRMQKRNHRWLIIVESILVNSETTSTTFII